MGVENFVNISTRGQRAAKRSRVLLAAKLRTESGEVEARLRDISRRGALVECASPPAAGSMVEFVRGDVVVPARVAWSSPGRLGLEFQETIDEAELLIRLKRSTSEPAQPRFRRPRLDEQPSEEELKMHRAWGVTMGLTKPGRRI